MHKVKSNTFLDEVLTDVFLILQQKSDCIVTKGLTWTKLWEKIIC
jgi:hypothetical protein